MALWAVPDWVAVTAAQKRRIAYVPSIPGRSRCGLVALGKPRRGVDRGRDDILGKVWDNPVNAKQRSIDRCVATLRAKIEFDPHRPNFIHTVCDIGYRFDPEAE